MRKTILALLVVVLGCLGVGRAQQTQGFGECSKQLQGDRIHVSPGALEQQVLNKVLPDASDLKGTSDSDVGMKVLIDPSGAVACAIAVKGDPRLFERSQNAARNWKVRPYMVNGTPIVIESVFVFHYHNGKVSVRF